VLLEQRERRRVRYRALAQVRVRVRVRVRVLERERGRERGRELELELGRGWRRQAGRLWGHQGKHRLGFVFDTICKVSLACKLIFLLVLRTCCILVRWPYVGGCGGDNN
jgi:hypothetical protein